MIALEVCSLTPEYPVEAGTSLVILSQDGYGKNTYGYEIAHLGLIANCIQLLHAFCETEFA